MNNTFLIGPTRTLLLFFEVKIESWTWTTRCLVLDQHKLSLRHYHWSSSFPLYSLSYFNFFKSNQGANQEDDSDDEEYYDPDVQSGNEEELDGDNDISGLVENSSFLNDKSEEVPYTIDEMPKAGRNTSTVMEGFARIHVEVILSRRISGRRLSNIRILKTTRSISISIFWSWHFLRKCSDLQLLIRVRGLNFSLYVQSCRPKNWDWRRQKTSIVT